MKKNGTTSPVPVVRSFLGLLAAFAGDRSDQKASDTAAQAADWPRKPEQFILVFRNKQHNKSYDGGDDHDDAANGSSALIGFPSV